MEDLSKEETLLARYWKMNVRIVLGLLSIWAGVSLGCGILFAEALNAYSFIGFPLGFWFAQQGSIIVFVFLILCYALLLNKLDAWYAKELRALNPEEKSTSSEGEG